MISRCAAFGEGEVVDGRRDATVDNHDPAGVVAIDDRVRCRAPIRSVGLDRHVLVHEDAGLCVGAGVQDDDVPGNRIVYGSVDDVGCPGIDGVRGAGGSRPGGEQGEGNDTVEDEGEPGDGMPGAAPGSGCGC